MSPGSVGCKVAMDELRRSSANVRRFWNLLYAVACGTTVTLLYAFLLLLRGQGVSAIASGVASLVGGVGVGFLIKMKNDAVKELARAKKAVREDCASPGGDRGGESEGQDPILNEVLDLL